MTAQPVDLAALNALDDEAFVAMLGAVFEHSPWVASAVLADRPFPSVAALHSMMMAAVLNAGPVRQLALLQAHPELARPVTLTVASTAEQRGMGLDRLAADEAAAFSALNSAYRARFGFPFIIAVRGQRDRTAIRIALSDRIGHTPEQEMAAALAEVAKITRFRLDDLIRDSSAAGQ